MTSYDQQKEFCWYECWTRSKINISWCLVIESYLEQSEGVCRTTNWTRATVLNVSHKYCSILSAFRHTGTFWARGDAVYSVIFRGFLFCDIWSPVQPQGTFIFHCGRESHSSSLLFPLLVLNFLLASFVSYQIVLLRLLQDCSESMESLCHLTVIFQIMKSMVSFPRILIPSLFLKSQPFCVLTCLNVL